MIKMRGNKYGILDIYVCMQYADTSAYDYIRAVIEKAAAQTDQFYLWLPDENVHAEYGYMELRTSVFWQIMVAYRLDIAVVNGGKHVFGDRKE